MGNSALVDYVKLSPNYSKRTGKISKITIHHMGGNFSIESVGNGFASKERQASSNYGVGTDGRVAMYVPECYRAWTSSSKENDNVAVTIEVANDVSGGNWHVSDKALEKTIELCVDICKRNGIKRINFTGDKSGNLTMHKWFAATGCPGAYLESKFPYIADEINKRLEGDTMTAAEKKELEALKNRVQQLEAQAAVKWQDIKDVPVWMRTTIEKLINKGYLKGNTNGSLELSYQLARMFVILDRSGIFGK